MKENKNSKAIDLHGFTLAESIYIVEQKLKLLEEKKNYDNLPNISMTIITGKGQHSQERKAVLHPKLTIYLKGLRRQNKYKLKVDEKSDEGAIYVTIF